MKKLFILLLLLPCITSAKTFKLSLGGGFIPKSGDFPRTWENSWIRQGETSITPLIGTFKATFTFPHIEAGIGMEGGDIQRSVTMKENYFEQSPIKKWDVSYAATFIAPYGFVNGTLNLGSGFSIYGGLMGGLYCPFVGETMMAAIPDDDRFVVYGEEISMNADLNTIVWGMQAGARYTIVKGFQVYTEFAGRSTLLQGSIYNSHASQRYRLWYFPVTAGLSVRLAKW